MILDNFNFWELLSIQQFELLGIEAGSGKQERDSWDCLMKDSALRRNSRSIKDIGQRDVPLSTTIVTDMGTHQSPVLKLLSSGVMSEAATPDHPNPR